MCLPVQKPLYEHFRWLPACSRWTRLTRRPGASGSTSLLCGGVSSKNFTTTASNPNATILPYKVLFAGSDNFSVKILDALYLQKNIDELQVLVLPDRRSQRGMLTLKRRGSPKSIKLSLLLIQAVPSALLRTRAEELDIPFNVVPYDHKQIWPLKPPFDQYSPNTIFVTASFGHLIPNWLLDRFQPMNAINVHPSLLPKYRGAAPIQWTIANADSETGVTVQTLSRGAFDKGRILAQHGVKVYGQPSYYELEGLLADIGARLLVDTLAELPKAQAQAYDQDMSMSTKAPKIESQHAWIDWKSSTAEGIYARHRAISHQFPLYTILLEGAPKLRGKRVQLLDVRVVSDISEHSEVDEPGKALISQDASEVLVACAGGTVLGVKMLKAEGRKALSAGEWWNGAVKPTGQSTTIFGAL